MFNSWLEQSVPSRSREHLCAPTAKPSPLQAALYDSFVARLIGILRPSMKLSFKLGRGAKTLLSMLNQFSEHWDHESTMFECDEALLTTSQDVRVGDLRLPDVAGNIQAAHFLPEAHRKVFDSKPQRVISIPPSQIPKPCLHVAPAEEASLRRRLLDTGMCVVIEESLIDRREDDRPLLNGLFAVEHSSGQRAIFDCRPANSSEVRLPWTRLPAGPQLTWLRVSRLEAVRGSGDDVANYFYQLSEAP